MLQHACKEWAAICVALARGKQTVLLRKGGISEEKGEFVLEHRRFWLYPTYLHQTLAGLHPEAADFFHLSLLARPAEGEVCLTHFAEITACYQLHDMVGVYRLQPFHCWSQQEVENRFAYRRPGLHALVARVFQARHPAEIKETPAYAGCKSWVELEQPQSTEGATPVLSDVDFSRESRRIEEALRPIATT